jgi:RimJ/RimL family protein N-acetyltransferase
MCLRIIAELHPLASRALHVFQSLPLLIRQICCVHPVPPLFRGGHPATSAALSKDRGCLIAYYSEADVRFFLNHVVPKEPTWAILWRQTRELIGMISLAPAPDGRSAELGYYIARDHWNRGVATEAALAVTVVGFASFGYLKLTSGYHADNPASGRVLAKLGFTVVGTSSRPCLADGKDKASVEVEWMP